MNKIILISYFIVFILFLFGCKNKSITEKKFNKDNFEKDLTNYFEANKIDSLIYYRGLLLKTEEFSNKMEGKSYLEVIEEIENRTKIIGYTNNQFFEDDYVRISGVKKFTGRDSIINFSFKINFKDSTTIKIGDSVKMAVYFQNIGGGQIMTQIDTKEIREEHIESLQLANDIKINFREFYKFKPSDFVSSSKLTDSVVIKYSNFCILYLEIRREGKLIKKIELV